MQFGGRMVGKVGCRGSLKDEVCPVRFPTKIAAILVIENKIYIQYSKITFQVWN